MNAMTAIAAPAPAAAPARNTRFERRLEVRVPAAERRHDKAEQQASMALATHLREVREHSYLSGTAPRFRIC